MILLADIRGALRLVSSACGASADLVLSWAGTQRTPSRAIQGACEAYNKLQDPAGTIDPQDLDGASIAWETIGEFRCIVTRPNT